MNDDQPQGNPWIKSLLIWAVFPRCSVVDVQPALRSGRYDDPLFRFPRKGRRRKCVRCRSGRNGSRGHSRKTSKSRPYRSRRCRTDHVCLQEQTACATPARRRKGPTCCSIILAQPAAVPAAHPRRGLLCAPPGAKGRLDRVPRGSGQVQGQASRPSALARPPSTRCRAASTKRARSCRRSSKFLRDPSRFSKLGGQIPEGRAAGRPARHRQDAARARRRRRSGRAVLHHLRFRLRRDVRRRRRQPRARHSNT